MAKLDYHALPRRQLQALCKKHGIPANGTNVSMADALDSIEQQEAKEQNAVKEQQQVDEETVANVSGSDKDIGSSADLSGISEKAVEGDSETLPAEFDTKCERKSMGRVSRRRGCKVEAENQSIEPKESKKIPAKEGKTVIEAENCNPARTNTTLDIRSVEAQKNCQSKIRQAHFRASTKIKPNSEGVELEEDAKAPAEEQNMETEVKSCGSVGEFTEPKPNEEVTDLVESEKKKCQRELRRKASKKVNSSAAQEVNSNKVKEDLEAPAKQEKSIRKERGNLLDNFHSTKNVEAQHVELQKKREKKPGGRSATTRACKVELEPLKLNDSEIPAVNEDIEREHDGNRSIIAHVTPQKEPEPIQVKAGSKRCQKKLRGNTSQKLGNDAEGESKPIKPESPDVEASIITEDKDKNKEVGILSPTQKFNPESDGVTALAERENNCERKVRERSGTRRACKAEPKVVSAKVKADAKTLAMKENVEPHASRSFCTHEAPKKMLECIQVQSGNKRSQRILKDNVCEKPAIEVERKMVFSAVTEDPSAPVSKEKTRIADEGCFCPADDSHSQKSGVSDSSGLEKKPKCEMKLRGRSGKERVTKAEFESESAKVKENTEVSAPQENDVELEANNNHSAQEMPQKIEVFIHVESKNRNCQRGLNENAYRRSAIKAERKAEVESGSKKKDCQIRSRGRASVKLIGGNGKLDSQSANVNEDAEDTVFFQKETDAESKDSLSSHKAHNLHKGMESVVVQSENKKSQRQLRGRTRNKRENEPEAVSEVAKLTDWTAATAKLETAAEEVVIAEEASSLQKSVETEQLQPLKEAQERNLRVRACIQLKSEVESESECVNVKEVAKAPSKQEQVVIERRETIGRRPSRKLGNKTEMDLNSAKTKKDRTYFDKEEKAGSDGEFTSATVITESKETAKVSENSTKLDALRLGFSKGRLCPEAEAVSSISMVDISKEECVGKAYVRKSRRGSLANQTTAKVNCSETSLKIQARGSMRHNQSSVDIENDHANAEGNFSKKSEAAESDVNNILSTVPECLTLDLESQSENSRPVPEVAAIHKEVVQLVSLSGKGKNCTPRISARKPVSTREQTSQSLDENKKVCIKTSRKDEKSEREKSISAPNSISGSEASASVHKRSSRDVSSKNADATPLNISYHPDSDKHDSSFRSMYNVSGKRQCQVSRSHIKFNTSEGKSPGKLLIEEIESNQLDCLEETGKQVDWEEKSNDKEHATSLTITETKDHLLITSAQVEKVLEHVHGKYEAHLTQDPENDKAFSLEDGQSKYDMSTSESQFNLRVERQNSEELFHKTPAFEGVCNLDEEKKDESCEPEALCSYMEAQTCENKLLLEKPEKMMPIEESQTERGSDTQASRLYNSMEGVCCSKAKLEIDTEGQAFSSSCNKEGILMLDKVEVQTVELLAVDEFQTVGTDFSEARPYGGANNDMEEANCSGDANMEDRNPDGSRSSFREVETFESSSILNNAEVETKILLPVDKFQTYGGNDIQAKPCGWASKSEERTTNSELYFLMEAGEDLTAEPSLTFFQVSSQRGKEEEGYMLKQEDALEAKQNLLADILSMKWAESGDKHVDVESRVLTESHDVELVDMYLGCTDVTQDISLVCDQTDTEITRQAEAPKEILQSPERNPMTWIVSEEVHQDTENECLTKSSQIHVIPGDNLECVDCKGNVSQECNLVGIDATPGKRSEVPKERLQPSGFLQQGEVYGLHVLEGHILEGLLILNAELLRPVDSTFCSQDKNFADLEGKSFEKGVLPASFREIQEQGTFKLGENAMQTSKARVVNSDGERQKLGEDVSTTKRIDQPWGAEMGSVKNESKHCSSDSGCPSNSAIKMAGSTWQLAEAPIKEGGRELTPWSFAGIDNTFDDIIQSSNDMAECREHKMNAPKSSFLPEMEMCEDVAMSYCFGDSRLLSHSNAEVASRDLPFHVVEASAGRSDRSFATAHKISNVAQCKDQTEETPLQNSFVVSTIDNNLSISISTKECSSSEDLKAQPFSNEDIKSTVDCILATVGSIMAEQDTSNRSIQLKRLVLEKAENSIDAVVSTLAERCQLAGIGKGSAWAGYCPEVDGFMGMSSQTQELVNTKLNSPMKTGVDDTHISGSCEKRKILDGVKEYNNDVTSEKAIHDRINNFIDATLQDSSSNFIDATSQDSSSKANRPKTVVLRSEVKSFKWELNSEKTMVCRVALSEDEPLESEENESIETETSIAYKTQISLNVDSDSDDEFHVLVSADDTEKATNVLNINNTSMPAEVEVLVEQNCVSGTLLSFSIEHDAESNAHKEVDKQSRCIEDSIMCWTGSNASEEAKNFSSDVLQQEKESMPTTIKKLMPACSVEPAFPSAKNELNLGHQMAVEFHGKENDFDLNKLSLRKLKALYKERKQNSKLSDHREIVEKEEHRAVLTPVSVNIMEGGSSNYLNARHKH